MLFEHGAKDYQSNENHLPNAIMLRGASGASQLWLILCRELCRAH